MQYFNILFSMFNEMAPYLLLGFFFAGILHVFIPQSIFSKYLAKNNFSSVFTAALFGVPLPLCSCGVIPAAMALRKEGASKGSVISFLIATPQTGIDSIMATYSLLGLPFAIIRPAAAFITAILGGVVSNIFTRKEESFKEEMPVVSCKIETKTAGNKIMSALKYGFVDIIRDIGKRLAAGLLIAAMITYFVPESFFSFFAGNTVLGILFVLALAIPMYVCATASIPIAIALMMKGFSPGTALVLLMAGPATNIASILVISKILGKKSMALYLGSIIFGAVSFALIIDYFLPAQWFNVSMMHEMVNCHNASFSWLKIISGSVLFALIINSFIMNYFTGKKNRVVVTGTHAYKVDGMHCEHCKNSVIASLKKIDGIKSVEVDLKNGIIYVEGNVEEAKIKDAVNSLGFVYKGANT
ncbi:MAG: SO_0444 family Cu/Zn efflux transporter [Endomicrobiaceae bacterium]|nr:SO_0444 family Cu/Zn efflux transporter [Endomicrobiaceae bacterium]